jgi:mannan endo-1,4-beta-mannosidase
MAKKVIVIAALAVSVGAAIFLFRGKLDGWQTPARPGFVQVRGGRFMIDGRPFRFVGANVSVMYRDDDSAHMPETLRQAAQAGIKVVRVWAFGEGGPDDVKPIGEDFNDWPRTFFFRKTPDQWNENAFVELDRTIAEAARNNLRVQLCLTNWWRDTGGVTQYLRWAGIKGADDDKLPFGVNVERAMLFYTNETTRRLYRQHLEKVATRRNSVTGVLYRDDPTIFGYELINEGQSLTLRWAERRAWFAEMSAYLKSLDPDHLIAPGDWGYRTAAERREWLADHALPHIDYCDVHNYPIADHDLVIDSPDDLRQFIDNRVAAAYSVRKPLVFGEFGMGVEGYKGFAQSVWFRTFFEASARAGAGGAIFWIITPDPKRGYGVTYTTARDQAAFAEIKRAAELFASLEKTAPSPGITNTTQHLVPRQFAFTRALDDPGIQPQLIARDDHTLLYRFKSEAAVAQRFEKIGSGSGYLWGSGVGFVEYLVPGRQDRRRVGRLIVRAHLQPVLPVDSKPAEIRTRVTLFINGTDCGSRLIPVEPTNPAWKDWPTAKNEPLSAISADSNEALAGPNVSPPNANAPSTNQPLIQEWSIDSWALRLRAARGLPLTIRFVVTVDSDWLYGVNISNWPEGYDAHDAKPVEVEVR